MNAIIKSEAAKRGYAVFNNGPHTIIDIPNGHSTLSLKLPTGQRMALAFIPYDGVNAPNCVDIKLFDTGNFIRNGERDVETMRVIVFTVGDRIYQTLPDDEQQPTLVTLLLE